MRTMIPFTAELHALELILGRYGPLRWLSHKYPTGRPGRSCVYGTRPTVSLPIGFRLHDHFEPFLPALEAGVFALRLTISGVF
jgi:hypothetical protein